MITMQMSHQHRVDIARHYAESAQAGNLLPGSGRRRAASSVDQDQAALGFYCKGVAGQLRRARAEGRSMRHLPDLRRNADNFLESGVEHAVVNGRNSEAADVPPIKTGDLDRWKRLGHA